MRLEWKWCSGYRLPYWCGLYRTLIRLLKMDESLYEVAGELLKYNAISRKKCNQTPILNKSMEKTVDYNGFFLTPITNYGIFSSINRKQCSNVIMMLHDYCVTSLVRTYHNIVRFGPLGTRTSQVQLGKEIKVLRSDRGGEYLSIKFNDYVRDCGIVSQLTSFKTPHLNGVAERRNQTLLDMVCSMMSRASLPITFWGMHVRLIPIF
ncbi:hypothetical protein LXL04_017332 [Taraxacum kok-saghyz]